MKETIQNAEFETLLAHDSSEDFSDTDRQLGSCSKYHEEICCCSAAKGHGMRIGEEFLEEIHFNVINATEQYRIIREKFKTRICRLDLYNAISKFRRESTPDNNLKNRIVAQAIVDDETQLSYEWAFQCVKEATGASSKVFVTDGDLAVNATITIQFPNTFDIHCVWHISQTYQNS
ncbi:protein FAR1-RELATED SEQUENCE 5-like [Rhizophagus irregularis DAOM 181602=DAOM 197198]|nr:protein FAR1-RELATED SEQUENCE 5-like [Rhizophagus irregularis DAOM 181602=DAOM 197198]